MSRSLRIAWPAVLLAAGLSAHTAVGQPPPDYGPQQKSPVQHSPVQAPQAVKSAAPQVVKRTILVPETTYKTVTREQVVMKPVQREETIPITRIVPERRTV